jgi:LDH2 family malate/lactate/ureidoglycolate dehydrogenase
VVRSGVGRTAQSGGLNARFEHCPFTEARILVRFERMVLEQFGSHLLQAAGCEEESAQLVARTLVRSDARGTASHGLIRVLDYAARLEKGGNDPRAQPRLVNQSGAVGVVDGTGALGQLIGDFAMRLAIELAREHGIGAIACRNSSHFGAAIEYSLLAASNDCIGIALTNASASMAPFGGVSPVLGNNPIAIAAPTHQQDVFALDLALSVVAKGRIRMLAARGERIPEGWANDKFGVPTTDPAEAVAGLAAWVGGYKGYGLALAADVLSGVLSGGGFGPNVGAQADASHPQNVAHCMIAVHVPHFLPMDAFQDRMTDLLGAMRSSELAGGSLGIRIPGEIEAEAERLSAIKGIDIADGIWQQLEAYAGTVNVPIPLPLPS